MIWLHRVSNFSQRIQIVAIHVDIVSRTFDIFTSHALGHLHVHVVVHMSRKHNGHALWIE